MTWGRRFSSGWAGLGGWRGFFFFSKNTIFLLCGIVFFLTATDHNEGAIANNWEQTNHPQHSRLARQHIAANLLVFGDFALLGSAYTAIYVHGSLHALD